MINNSSHNSSSPVAGRFLHTLAIILPALGMVLMVSSQPSKIVAETRQGDPIIPPPTQVTSSSLL